MRAALRVAGVGAGAAFLCGAVWFAVFLRPLEETNAPQPARADGVVVLTGGAGRVEAGLALLASGAAPHLLVSGVFDPLTDARFLAQWPEAEPWFECCITLGRRARDTHGNAAETAAWAEAGSRRRLFLVTSDFHLRRALVEHRRALPEAEFIPVAVETRMLSPRLWLASPRAAVVSFGESLKYLAALAGLTHLRPAFPEA